MRMLIVCWILVVSLAAHHARAGGDVDYQLDAKSFAATEEIAGTLRTPIEFKDRAWAVPGVEESDIRLDRSENTGYLRSHRLQRIRLEREGTCDGPSWLDDVAWPRTRQMFHRAYYEEQIFCFGGIALQR